MCIQTNRSVVGARFKILGLDYKFKKLRQCNIGVDVKLIIDFYDGAIMYFDTGLSVRLTFLIPI